MAAQVMLPIIGVISIMEVVLAAAAAQLLLVAMERDQRTLMAEVETEEQVLKATFLEALTKWFMDLEGEDLAPLIAEREE
jgi:hypothetical protein